MVASRSMTGLTGDPHLNEGFLLRIYAGGVAAGALIEPDSFGRLIGEVGHPLPGGKVVLGGKDDQVVAFPFKILLLPLAAQGVSYVFLGKRSDLAGYLKIADIHPWIGLDVPHHPGMEGSPPLQIPPFVAPLARLRAGEGGAGSVFVLALELGHFEGQFSFSQRNCCDNNNQQREGENGADD